jgi:hypothetical protein
VSKIEDLGDWAESAFAAQCSAAGATRNKSVQDRTGWDYLVEFPVRRLLGLPGDLQPSEMSAQVQVKSKKKGRASVKIKLSNALRFANNPTPCFLVLYLATDGGHPVRTFAKHFWHPEIEHALRRAREAGDVPAADLARQTLTLSFAPEDEHSDDLLAWMEATVLPSGDRYAETKLAFSRSVGLGDGSIHGSISFEADDLAALVDHQIGLIPTAPIVDVTIKQKRFGIDAPVPMFSGRPTIVNMRTHPKPCRVRVRGVDDLTISMPGQIYSPSIPDLPEELFKLRVVADFMELIVTHGGQVTMNLESSADIQRPLGSLKALIDTLTQSGSGPLDISIFVQDQVLFTFVSPQREICDPRWLLQMMFILECLGKVCEGNESDGLTISISEIMAAWEDIVRFTALVTGTNFQANLTLEWLQTESLNGRWLLFYDHVEIGSWALMAVVARPITEVTGKGLQWRIHAGAPSVREGLIRRGPAELWLTELQSRYALALQISGPETMMVFDGDFRALWQGLVAEG